MKGRCLDGAIRGLASFAVVALCVCRVAAAQPAAPALPGFCLFARGTAIASSHAGAVAKYRLEQIEASNARANEQRRQLLALEGATLYNRRGSLPPDQFAAQASKLQAEVRSLDSTIRVQSAQVAQARASALARIDSVLDPILDSVRASRRCVVVMERNNAYVYANSVDLTSEVIERLDKALSPFAIEFPALGAGKG